MEDLLGGSTTTPATSVPTDFNFATDQSTSSVTAAASTDDMMFSSAPADTTTSPSLLNADPIQIELAPQAQFEASPLRIWEKEHAEMLVTKSKQESERHQKTLATARSDVEQMEQERAKRCEAKARQNKDEEMIFREAQKKATETGDVWLQASKVVDLNQKRAGDKDVSRMRSLLLSLKTK